MKVYAKLQTNLQIHVGNRGKNENHAGILGGYSSYEVLSVRELHYINIFIKLLIVNAVLERQKKYFAEKMTGEMIFIAENPERSRKQTLNLSRFRFLLSLNVFFLIVFKESAKTFLKIK